MTGPLLSEHPAFASRKQQLSLFTPEPVTPPVQQPPRTRRPKPDDDPRWVFAFVAPSPAEFKRLVDRDNLDDQLAAVRAIVQGGARE